MRQEAVGSSKTKKTINFLLYPFEVMSPSVSPRKDKTILLVAVAPLNGGDIAPPFIELFYGGFVFPMKVCLIWGQQRDVAGNCFQMRQNPEGVISSAYNERAITYFVTIFYPP